MPFPPGVQLSETRSPALACFTQSARGSSPPDLEWFTSKSHPFLVRSSLIHRSDGQWMITNYLYR